MTDMPREHVVKELRRRDENELRELAVGIVEGNVFMAFSEDALRCAFSIPLLFTDLKEIVEQVGAVYEDTEKAGPRTVNGYPCFFSMKLLHIDDVPLLASAVDAYQAAKAAFLEGHA